mmetsp:Transcript_28692/g.28423  ORF Transcript_28692/g.28423 Transcript_28692/m.28423 type:complete len:137 (+) Transcript_28692:13-423(+)
MAKKADDDLPLELKNKYGSYKVGEFTHGRVRERQKKAQEGQAPIDTAQPDKEFLKNMQEQDVDYKKRYTLGEKKKNFDKEYRSSKDVFKEFSPRKWRKQLNYIQKLTPDEYETVLDIYGYFKRNSILYGSLFFSLT